MSEAFPYLTAVVLSDIGCRRENNEDAVLSLPQCGVFAVADGMGGAAAGEVASRFTVEAIRDAFTRSPDAPFALTAESSARLLVRAVNDASQAIKAYAAAHSLAGPGTTVVVLAFDRATPARACVLHAGDSRAYRFRDGLLSQLTADHSLAAAAGVTEEERLPMRFRGVITRAVGLAPDVELERTALAVRPNDLYLLCTDGLSKMVPDPQLAALLTRESGRPLEELAQLLIDHALHAGGEDNVSVLLVRVADRLPPAADAPLPRQTRLLENELQAQPTGVALLKEIIRKSLSHDAPPLVQFIKYGVVGGMATALHIVTFFLCGWLLLPCLTQDDIAVRLLGLTAPVLTPSTRAWNAGFCNAIGFVLSNTFCYVLNRLFVFKPGRHHWVTEFLLFFAVSGISMVLGTAIQTFLITQAGFQTTPAFGANIVCALFINYAMRKFVIFKG